MSAMARPIPAPPALSNAALPSPLPVPTAGVATEIRAWRVLHASERARDVLSLIEIQSAAGMRPWLVTAAHDRATPSLLNTWQHVREWRRIIVETEPTWNGDLVHAHSFASGMAAVRNCAAVVYDVSALVEESSREAQAELNSWLARSFRVAEQFVIARAAAVVVHTPDMLQLVLRRGADPAGTFLLQPLLPPAKTARAYDRIYRHAYELRKRTHGRILPPGLQPVAACL
jgi:hypothetical protein